MSNLHEDVTEEALHEIFQGYGPMQSLRVCRDRITHASLCYGYVNFLRSSDAQNAMRDLNFSCSPKTMNKPIRVFWKIRDSTLRRTGAGNIVVRGLGQEFDDRTLYDIFARFGRILSSKVATDANGVSLGHGYVQFESPEAAKEAVKDVNGLFVKSTRVFVGPFIPKDQRSSTDNPNGRYTNVYVKDVDQAYLREEKMRELFADYGYITSLCIPRKANGSPIGFAFLNFDSPENAKLAVTEMNGRQVGGSVMHVARAENKSEREVRLRKKHLRKRD